MYWDIEEGGLHSLTGKRKSPKRFRQEGTVSSSMPRTDDSGTYGEEGLFRSRERHVFDCKSA